MLRANGRNPLAKIKMVLPSRNESMAMPDGIARSMGVSNLSFQEAAVIYLQPLIVIRIVWQYVQLRCSITTR